MKYKIKEREEGFVPVTLEIRLQNGRELANFARAMSKFGRQYLDDYDDNIFYELSGKLVEIMEAKIESGEMSRVE